jgi:hypothetical protein
MSLLLAISHGYHYIANRPNSSESKQSNGRTFWKRTSVSWLLLEPLQTSWFQLELVLFLLGYTKPQEQRGASDVGTVRVDGS